MLTLESKKENEWQILFSPRHETTNTFEQSGKDVQFDVIFVAYTEWQFSFGISIEETNNKLKYSVLFSRSDAIDELT